MPYEQLREQRKIRPHGLRPGEVTRRVHELWTSFEVAYADAQSDAQSLDGRFQDAYSALRHLVEIVITAEGFRPAPGPGHQEVLFAFLTEVPTVSWKGRSAYFQRCRRRRAKSLYERVGLITKKEVEDLLVEVDLFAAEVRAWLARAHPTLPRKV